MDSLQIVFSGNKERDIYAIAQYIENHIAENWQTLIQQNRDKLVRVSNKANYLGYSVYSNWLYGPVNRKLKQVGLHLSSRLPGNLDLSREWGNADESDQQRWSWSTIHSAEGEALGTIVTILFHDHNQFRLPRSPQVFALTEIAKEDIVDALSQRSDDFKNAREDWIVVAEYLQSLESTQ
jgi:Family of unknown function (DUF6022)